MNRYWSFGAFLLVAVLPFPLISYIPNVKSSMKFDCGKGL